ncbi:hypothetical protein [Paraburkholderia caledonica]|uniref:Uncharacterized protein n=1 Tax=Paraburkholderia caledonica TaxID=134536 RepID=A0AB73IN91_9BURK|nr:hypothetical protein [Paraburkholderia caledonica]
MTKIYIFLDAASNHVLYSTPVKNSFIPSEIVEMDCTEFKIIDVLSELSMKVVDADNIITYSPFSSNSYRYDEPTQSLVSLNEFSRSDAPDRGRNDSR